LPNSIAPKSAALPAKSSLMLGRIAVVIAVDEPLKPLADQRWPFDHKLARRDGIGGTNRDSTGSVQQHRKSRWKEQRFGFEGSAVTHVRVSLSAVSDEQSSFMASSRPARRTAPRPLLGLAANTRTNASTAHPSRINAILPRCIAASSIWQRWSADCGVPPRPGYRRPESSASTTRTATGRVIRPPRSPGN
jgi:hypothetical protein